MALIEIKCDSESLADYFNRQTFQDATEPIRETSTISRLVLEKYLHPKYKNDLIFNGNRYLMGNYSKKFDIAFFDDYSNDIFLGIEEKTVHLVHYKPKRFQNPKIVNEEKLKLVTEKIKKSQRLKGISSEDQIIIDTLRFHYPVEAFHHKWLADLDYAYNAEAFNVKETFGGSFLFSYQNEFGLCPVIDKNLIKRFEGRAQYSTSNKPMMNKIPNLVKRGDPIHRIIQCKGLIAVEKTTDVTWFIVDD